MDNLEKNLNQEETSQENKNEAVKEVVQTTKEVRTPEIEPKDYSSLGFQELINEAQILVDSSPLSTIRIPIRNITDAFKSKAAKEAEQQKQEFLQTEENKEEDFKYNNPYHKEFYNVIGVFRNQMHEQRLENEKKEEESLKLRQNLIQELKSLYTEPQENSKQVFSKFNEIRDKWKNAGRIPKANADEVFNNYRFHQDNFFKFIEMDKEFMSMNYEQNLEQRNQIIERAKGLLELQNVQKALTELQYLHKLWKEEGSPVAEEHSETTWQVFKEISDKIHDKKAELRAKADTERKENLVKKTALLEKIKAEVAVVTTDDKSKRAKIKTVDALREQFLAVGSAPKQENNKLWEEFKAVFKTYNKEKTSFFKEQKKEYKENLAAKKALLERVKEALNTDDWEASVKEVKKIQSEWREIGFVPRKLSDKVWEEFKATCNQFFDAYRGKKNQKQDVRRQRSFAQKDLVKKIKSTEVTDANAVEVLSGFAAQWSSFGGASEEVTDDYQKTIAEKIESLSTDSLEIKKQLVEKSLESIKESKDEDLVDKEIGSVKYQMTALNLEINRLENNLAFFSSKKKNNPILEQNVKNIERKKQEVVLLKQKLKALRTIDFTPVSEVEPETETPEATEITEAEDSETSTQ